MASELVYTAFCDNPQKQLAETMKQPPLDRDNSLRVRIVTPQDSFVLENGQPVPLSITLQQLRRIIAQRLDIPIDSIHEPKTQRGSCNCGLGRIIARYGLNDMILARHHKQKGFTSVYGDETQQECGICTESLFHPCPGCRNDPPPDQVDDCGIVRNIGCLHPFHHHCFVRAYYNSRSLRKECPYQPSCPLGSPYEMAPNSEVSSPTRLIVGYGQSCLEVFNLDQSFGGTDGSQPSVQKEVLGSLLRELLGSALHEGSTWGVFNNEFQKDEAGKDVVNFNHSLVVGVCAGAQKSGCNGRIRFSDASVLADTVPADGVMFDIHTASSLIGTRDPDMSLEALCVKEEASNGILTLYAVPRHAEVSRLKVGKDAIFSFNKAWEMPTQHEQSERGYACFLSCLRNFVSSFADNLPAKDRLLRMLWSFTNFPPAVRAMHVLVDQATPNDEDCAALIQALHKVTANYFVPEAETFEPRRVLEFSRSMFGYLQNVSCVKYKRDQSGEFPFLQLFDTKELLCPITRNAICNPVLLVGDGGIMETPLAKEFIQGRLHLTHPKGPRALADNEETLKQGGMLRAALYSGGRFPKILVMTCVSDDAAVYNDATDEILNPPDVDPKTFSQTLTDGPLRIIPPADLSATNIPCLTLDARGWIAVFLGYQPCTAPPANNTFFCPTKGGDCVVDTAMVTQSLARLRESPEKDGAQESFSFAAVQTTPPSEIIMLCLDTSSSMDEPADFKDMQDVEGGESKMSVEEEDTFDVPPSTWNFAMIKQFLNGLDYFPDLLRIVQTGGSQHYRRQEAEDVLDDLITVYQRFARALPKISRTRLANLPIFKFLSAIKDSQMRLSILRYMAEVSGSDISIDGVASPNMPPQVPWLDGFVPREFACPVTGRFLRFPVEGHDGRLYEKDMLETWQSSYRHSPVTGLPMERGIVRNSALKRRFETWTMSESSGVTAGTKRNASESESETWQMTLRYCHTSWPLTITSQASPRLLKELAFRSLNTKSRIEMKNIEIFDAAGKLIPDEDSPISAHGLKNGDNIEARTKVPHLLANLTNLPIYPDRSERRCLIKLYRSSYNCPSTTYWLPVDTDASVLSVLVRYCLWSEHPDCIYEKRASPSEMEVWAIDPSLVDGSIHGEILDPFEPLRRVIQRWGRPGYVERGPAFRSPKSDNLDKTLTKVPWVLVLKLDDYESPRERERRRRATQAKLTRIHVVKQMFEAFINRTLAYRIKSHIGLITFSTEPRLREDITSVLEDFRSSLTQVNCNGETALWDALALAKERIMAYADRYPGAKRRIVCLTDGRDTHSTNKPLDLSENLQSSNIVVDSFIIGQEADTHLRSISTRTKGYKFNPQDIESAMGICELETVLNSLERPNEAASSHEDAFLPEQSSMRILGYLTAGRGTGIIDVVTPDRFPQMKEHPLSHRGYIALSDAADRMSNRVHATKKLQWSQKGPARLMFEMRNMIANIHPYYDVYVSEDDMSLWKIVMEGPPESPYAGAAFSMLLDLGEPYPMEGPRGRFITPILHPNITKQGRICHSNWTSDTSCVDVLNSIWGLLLVPDLEDPANTMVTQRYYSDRTKFEEVVKNHMQIHAKKTRPEFAQEYGA